MHTNDPAPNVEALLQHAEWVRAVARRLVSDENTAEDIAQDSWLAAIKSSPQPGSSGRGWLFGALRNRARERARSESRRREREVRAARPEAQASLEDLAQRAATQQEVVGHVLELEEPFRSVVLLRFFEDNTPPEIAERLDIPLKTVHSRLQRAFAKLRAKLDASYGDRESWCLALLPLAQLAPRLSPAEAGLAAAGTTTTLTATTIGVWIMSTQGKLALAAAVLLGGAWGFYGKGSEATTSSAVEPREEAVVTRELPRSDETITVVQTPSTGEHREVALEPEVPAPAQTVPVAEPAETQVVRGHVVDVSGTPVPGARVAMGNATQKERPTTDGSGWFEARFLPASPEESDGSVDTYTLRAEAEGWVTVRESVVRPNNLDRGHVVVVARTLHAEGWVRDTEGQPIEGARLSSNPIAGAFYNSAYVLDLTRSVGFGTTTDAQGHFSMEEFPQFPGSQFIVHAKGYLSRVIPIDGAAWPLQVELVRPQEEDIPSIQGIVRDELGLAVEGATVHLSRNRTQSDASGWFRLPLVHDYIADQTPLCATKPGHQAALIAGYGERLKSELPLPASVELTLGPEPLSISGKLLDPDGLPWPGWIVTVLDGTEISQHMVPIISAEQYSGMGTKRIITTDRGAFQIHGLFDREYLIQAYDPETLQVVSSHFRGGENDAVLQTPRVAPRLLRARVVDSQGQPVPNTRLSINLKTQTIRGGFTSIGGRSTVAGDDGRFQLEFIPHDRLYLNYSGEHIIPGNLVLDGSLEEDIQELVAARRCHFLIELPAGWEHVTRAQLLDAGGERLMLHQYQSGSASSFPSARAKNGKFMQLAVSDAARTLVLFEGEQEVHRVPITLTGEGVQVLRP